MDLRIILIKAVVTPAEWVYVTAATDPIGKWVVFKVGCTSSLSEKYNAIGNISSKAQNWCFISLFCGNTIPEI